MSYFIKVFALLIFLLGIAGSIYYIQSVRPEKILLEKKQLLQSAKRLENLWNNGPISLEKELTNCPYLKGGNQRIDSRFYQCNPHVIDCMLWQMNEGKGDWPSSIKSKIFLQKAFYTHGHYKIIRRKETHLSLNHPLAYLVQLTSSKYSHLGISLFLEANCHEQELPQGIYVSGSVNEEDPFVWDNLGQHIVIDKNLVTNRDLIEWLNFDDSLNIHKKKELKQRFQKLTENKLAAPGNWLLKDEMEKFCFFQGKEVLSSHIFDGATFLIKNNTSYFKTKKLFRSPLPWTRNFEESFLKKVKENTLYQMTQSDCQKIYALECIQKFPYEYFDTNSVSWAGLYEVMGGEMEYLKNIQNPLENLAATSRYFSIFSPWHQLGMRAHWDGEGLSEKNFMWENKNIKEESIWLNPQREMALGVGFRCMRYAK